LTQSAAQQDHSRFLSASLAFFGGLIGLVLSYGILSGDAQGQVNLLFLLLLFVVLPMLALLLSLVLVVRPGGRGLVGWILEMPFWSAQLRRQYLQRDLLGDRKAWLIYQTQFFSLGFSLGSLLLYMLLLLATDISFIWRSTLLEAEQLLPALDLVALPWVFWGDAQPSLALLEQTRDFRLLPADQSQNVVGLWWRYVLAAQVCYSLLPRTLLLALARYSLHRSARPDINADCANANTRPARPTPTLAELVENIPDQAQLLDWAGMPGIIRERLVARTNIGSGPQRVRPDSSYRELDDSGSETAIIVVVKAWEPPLAELADFLHTLPATTGATRLLLPLDWSEHDLKPVTTGHLNEWRRFANTLGDWKVMQLVKRQDDHQAGARDRHEENGP